MPALSVAAAVALALGTGSAPGCIPLATDGRPSVDPTVILSVALAESGLDPAAINQNADGTADFGMLQINTRNLQRLGLTPVTALDPCSSIKAAAQVLLESYDGGATDAERQRAILRSLSAYNTGSKTAGMETYVPRVLAAARKIIPALHIAGVAPDAAAPMARGKPSLDPDTLVARPAWARRRVILASKE